MHPTYAYMLCTITAPHAHFQEIINNIKSPPTKNNKQDTAILNSRRGGAHREG